MILRKEKHTEMAKKRKEHTEWIITKGQRSRWQKEQQRRRQLIIAISVVLAIVVILVIVALADSTASPYDKTVLKVTGPYGERTFDMDYYIDMMLLYGIRQAETEAELNSIAESTLNSISSNEVSRQLAQDLDISITEDEIDQRIEDYIMPEIDPGTDTEAPAPPSFEEAYQIYIANLNEEGVTEHDYREVILAEIARDRMQEEIGHREVPERMEQVHVLGILIDTSIPYSSAGTSSATPVTNGTPPTTGEDQFMEAEEIYEIIRNRWEAGEDFGELAKEYSQNLLSKPYGGELGWVPHEIATIYYGSAFENTAFTMPLNTLSELLPESDSEDNTRYWIIEVVDKDDEMRLSDNFREYFISKAFWEWYNSEMSRFTIKNDYLEQEDIIWALEKALKMN